MTSVRLIVGNALRYVAMANAKSEKTADPASRTVGCVIRVASSLARADVVDAVAKPVYVRKTRSAAM